MTVGVLAAVITLEGLRRLVPGAVVLRQAVWGAWGVATGPVERERWALVSRWPPLVTSVVLRAAASPSPTSDLALRLDRARPWIRGLTGLGTLVLVALLIVLPLAIARFGSEGFMAGLGAVAALAAAQSGLAAWARSDLGLRRRPALAALSPFASAQAAERVLEDVLADAPRLAAARALLPTHAFNSWIRPLVYDAAATAHEDRELADFLTPERRAEILASPERSPGADRHCPRCAAAYRQGDTCADCGGVALVPFGD